jgi:ADP-heptose:LPS heptosyltransferase
MDRPPAAERILILRLGAVGDVVRTLPAASGLRAAYPEARLAWLVEAASASLLQGQPWLDEVIVFPRGALREDLAGLRAVRLARRLLQFVRELRSRDFDLVVDFHSILKSGILARSSGAPIRVGYARPFGRELSWLFANRRARLQPARASRFERNAAMLQFLRIGAKPLERPLCIAGQVGARTAGKLDASRPFVVIHPGTSPSTAHKRYAPRALAAVARDLARSPGVESLVTHGPARDDRAAADAVVAHANGAARLAPTTGSLAELAALLERGRLCIGPDSGPLHLASLVGTPVVQILGPTDPVENAPYPQTPSRTVRVGVACSPCRRGCSAAPCMRVVPPAAVVRAARELLAVAEAGC